MTEFLLGNVETGIVNIDLQNYRNFIAEDVTTSPVSGSVVSSTTFVLCPLIPRHAINLLEKRERLNLLIPMEKLLLMEAILQMHRQQRRKPTTGNTFHK
mgnify:CR=1 FL=1